MVLVGFFVYLTVSANNRADTVLSSFLSAVAQLGLPSRVRSDKGGELVDVAELMAQRRGVNRNSHIAGRSVHNQRMPGTTTTCEVKETKLLYSQLWMGRMAQDLDDSTKVDINYGVDWVGPHSHHGSVSVPCDLTDTEAASLLAPADSCDDAVANYVETVQLIRSIFN